jgi:hypothetical protein
MAYGKSTTEIGSVRITRMITTISITFSDNKQKSKDLKDA